MLIDGVYTLAEGLINKKPYYINKEKIDLGALGATGWCITAMRYFEGIQAEIGTIWWFPFRRRCITDYGLWPNYTVTLTEEEDSEDDIITKCSGRNICRILDKTDVSRHFEAIKICHLWNGHIY